MCLFLWTCELRLVDVRSIITALVFLIEVCLYLHMHAHLKEYKYKYMVIHMYIYKHIYTHWEWNAKCVVNFFRQRTSSMKESSNVL